MRESPILLLNLLQKTIKYKIAMGETKKQNPYNVREFHGNGKIIIHTVDLYWRIVI